MTKIGQQNLRGLTFLKNSTYSEDDSREPLVEIAIKLSKNYATLLVRWPGYGIELMHFKPVEIEDVCSYFNL